MTTKLHGHIVLNTLIDAKEPLTLAALQAKMISEHGENLEFHTCSQQGLSLEALIEFFIGKGKVTKDGELLLSDPNRICHHN
ncbi:YecH family protein [Vibrio sp. SS-MA-C1-2]|uniref:YecH family metal-binding protein n=1 Tax=Vibrio sp. SS-MA-C1-2 TaxID=2908646 RepID=UPI001F1A6FB0|nr:YecH family metal-binding protein [Vibrio sp. SS-MA-C1-2]UJF19300.1 YecH family protein [Vibrio sp. SS-MA-C1-2]